MRRRAFLWLASVLLAWTAFGTALEIRRCGWIVANDPWTEPSRWRFRSAHVEELKGFLATVEEHLPPGAVVAFWSEPGPPEERYFRHLWTAYLLPRHEVRQARSAHDEAAGLGADFWITYGTRWPDALDIVVETADGALYRSVLRGDVSRGDEARGDGGR